MWYNSPHLFKQFPKIGSALSQALINGGIKSFKDMIITGPRRVEHLLGKNPPFGTTLIEAVRQLPMLKVAFEIVLDDAAASSQYFESSSSQVNEKISVIIRCSIENYDTIDLDRKESLLKNSEQLLFILGDSNDNLVSVHRLT